MFSPTKQAEVGNKFRKDADAYYVEAKRSTVASIAQIPTWMYGVLVVLGWNEAMLILFNPLYFTLLLLGLASSYVIMTLGLGGPLYQVARTLAGEVSFLKLSKIDVKLKKKPVPRLGPTSSIEQTSGTLLAARSFGTGTSINFGWTSSLYERDV